MSNRTYMIIATVIFVMLMVVAGYFDAAAIM